MALSVIILTIIVCVLPGWLFLLNMPLFRVDGLETLFLSIILSLIMAMSLIVLFDRMNIVLTEYMLYFLDAIGIVILVIVFCVRRKYVDK